MRARLSTVYVARRAKLGANSPRYAWRTTSLRLVASTQRRQRVLRGVNLRLVHSAAIARDVGHRAVNDHDLVRVDRHIVWSGPGVRKIPPEILAAHETVVSLTDGVRQTLRVGKFLVLRILLRAQAALGLDHDVLRVVAVSVVQPRPGARRRAWNILPPCGSLEY